MKLIAHRGLRNGPDKQIENSPATIKESLKYGFDCEIDLWVINDQLYLGHDDPTYSIDLEFIRTPGLWIHAKNLPALSWLTGYKDLNYFWHQEDNYTITSKGHIWAYPGQPVNQQCIMVMPELVDPSLGIAKNTDCYAICSDFVELLK